MEQNVQSVFESFNDQIAKNDHDIVSFRSIL